MKIALSISEPDPIDLARRGLSSLHLDDALVATARYLLARGDTLAYGGDLRERGFTRHLFDLCKSYDASDGDRVHAFLAWPIHLRLEESVELDLVGYARVHRLPPPPGAGDPLAYVAPDSDEHRALWAASLTAMRGTMTEFVDARVSLGGRLTGYSGRMPGIAEEVALALARGRPTFLLGGFGGCTAALAEALDGGTPRALAAIDDGALLRALAATSVAGLRNGLDEADNRRLFVTPHVPEMMALVLKGLAALAAAPPAAAPSVAPSG